MRAVAKRRAAKKAAAAKRVVLIHPGRRLAACGLLVVVVFGVLAFRVAQLQVLSGSRFRRLSLDQTLQPIALPAQRGTIFDRNGYALALSIQRTTVYADPTQVTDPVVYSAKLAPILHVSQAKLIKRLGAPKTRFQYLARRVSDTVVTGVRKLHLAGIHFLPEPERVYPAGALAGSIVGDVGGDGSGLDGLEYLYNTRLAGKAGSLVIERDNQGLEIASTARHEVEAQRGTDVVLTLDESLQWQAEQALVDEVSATRAMGGMAAVVDITNGNVLALASVDGATSTQPVHVSGPGERTGPLMDLYEPGSTNKLITLATAIQDGIVTPTTMIDVPPVLRVGSTDFKDVDAHGQIKMSVADILRQSSNIGTIEVAQNLSKYTLAASLRAFGLGAPTSIDFPGQSSGLLLDPAHYYDTGLASTAIGYGVAVTGMQMLDAYATIANGGVSRPPTLLDATIDAHGKQHAVQPMAGTRVVSERTASEMSTMLEGVVSGGTGVCAAIPGYTVAGKTGTSRKALATGGYSRSTMASFIGFVPASHPRLAAIVVIDAPETQYGGAAAAPVFADVMRFALTRDDVAPDDIGNTQYNDAQAAAAATGTQCVAPTEAFTAANALAAREAANARAAAAKAKAAAKASPTARGKPPGKSAAPPRSSTTTSSTTTTSLGPVTSKSG